MTKNPQVHEGLQMLSTLQHITHIAQNLSQPHFVQFLINHSSLHTLITSALNDLMNCVNIINAQAPISSLPLEVLNLVFQEVHHNEIQTLRQPLSRAPLDTHYHPDFQSPLLLSHVSRLWYNVTINSPHLWTIIEIYPSWDIPMINMFLARSKSYPIFLNIIAALPATHIELNDTVISKLCDVLVPQMSRCRSLFIETDDHFAPFLYTLYGHLHNQAAPLLEWLFLRIQDIDVTSPPSIFTLGTPRLSYLHLSPGGILVQSLPFQHLTTLHLDANGIEVVECVNVISRCPLLETLAIYDNLDSEMDVEPFILPHLRSLELYGEMTVVADVLLAVVAPSLESLVIAPFSTLDLEQLHDQEGLGPKKYATLRSVTLGPFVNTLDESLRLASECFPNVVDVTLIGRKSDILIGALENVDETLIFPNMRSLALRNLYPANEYLLRSLVASRNSRGMPLHTLYLDEASLQRMSNLRQLHDTIKVVELDKWSILRQRSMFCDEEDSMFYPWS